MIINIFRIKAYDSIMCGYFCIGFIGFMLKGKSFLDYRNFFSPNNYENNNKVILKCFQWLKRSKNYVALIAVKKEKLKTLKCHTSRESICSFCYFQ